MAATAGVMVAGSSAAGAADSTYTYEVSPPRDTGLHPDGVAVDPTMHTGYVALNSGIGESIEKYDMTTGERSGGLGTEDGDSPQSLAVDAATHTLWVAEGLGVDVFDLTDDTFEQQFPTGTNTNAADVAVDTVAHKVYFTVAEENTVTVIDEATRTISKVVDVGFQPTRLAVDSETHRVYLANYAGDSVTVLNGTSDTVAGTIPVGDGPSGLAVDPATRTLVVGNSGAGTVSFVDLTGARPTATVPAANGGRMSVDPTTATVYATNYDANTVTVLDESTRTVTATLGVGENPAGVGVDPTLHTVLVSDLTGTADPSEGEGGFTSFIRQRRVFTPQLDRTSVGYQAQPTSAVSAGSASTSGARELLLALVQADGPADGVQKVTSVSGGGLTWTRAKAVNTSGQGAVEVWQAYASSRVANVRVTARFAKPADGAIVVKSYTGAASTVGSSAAASATRGPSARVDLAPQSAGSLIVAGGLDWSSPTRPVPTAGQTIPNSFADRRAGDEYWVQAVTLATTTASTPMSIRAAVPSSSRWSIVAVEVRAADPGGNPS